MDRYTDIGMGERERVVTGDKDSFDVEFDALLSLGVGIKHVVGGSAWNIQQRFEIYFSFSVEVNLGNGFCFIL